ncbi:MAG: hypothetical protein KF773_17675 [Deltaproteobacteria bacterium]|nr:hypothetical protein [Deltaproteobacteria bacterium]
MRLRAALVTVALLAACGGAPSSPEVDAPIGPPPPIDGAVAADAAIDAPAAQGFGTLSGMCGALEAMDLTGTAPRVLRVDFDFARAYMDPADRPLLTPGGVKIAETPNAGGSSGRSEIFAFEELARCEDAALLKTETEIVYDTNSKKTDMLIEVGGHKIGVSVTRAFAFPLGTPYTLQQATSLVSRKLADIPLATASVSAADRWEKQFLAIMAIDDQAADTMAQAWSMLDPAVQGDTIIVLTTTTGADTFIYTNQ